MTDYGYWPASATLLTRGQAAALVANNPGISVSLNGVIARVMWTESAGPVPRRIAPHNPRLEAS